MAQREYIRTSANLMNLCLYTLSIPYSGLQRCNGQFILLVLYSETYRRVLYSKCLDAQHQGLQREIFKLYARRKVRLPKALQTRGLGAYFRTKFGNLGERKCHFLGFTRNIFKEKCNSCLLYPSPVLSVRYNMYGKKGQTATPSKMLQAKGKRLPFCCSKGGLR